MSWFSLIWPGQRPSPEVPKPAMPDWQELAKQYAGDLRPAAFATLGGFRPDDKHDRRRSWWGGNFLARAGEGIPVCRVSGRDMHPILQIRPDELTHPPGPLQGAALATFWLDLQSREWAGASDGTGFAVRTYETFDGLEPIGPGYREGGVLPTFPIVWQEIPDDQPDRENGGIDPNEMIERGAADWPYGPKKYCADFDAAVRVGGWPDWCQGTGWPEGAEFAFQIDSSAKGALGFGYSGSLYIFRTSEGWRILAQSF